MKEIIVIIGPTGVGKTKLSIELAKKLDAEIINGDSVAIYKKLNIGSAKPTEEEQKQVPHHLIDLKDPKEDYSVYDYQQDARREIKEITSRNKRVIIVGGTGLYIKAALYNYKFKKGTKNNTYDDLSNEEMLNKLKEYDETIDIHPNNRKRLVRMLNKYESKEEITAGKDTCLYPIYIVGLTAPREVVYDRINKRVDKMLEEGLIEEVEALKGEYLHSRVLNSAIGYKEFEKYLYEAMPIEEVMEKIKQDSRRYAKRQYTFFKHQFHPNWYSVNFDNFQETINQVYNDIKKQEAN